LPRRRSRAPVLQLRNTRGGAGHDGGRAGTGSGAGWAAEQNGLAKLSSISVHRTVAGATHTSLIENDNDARQSSRAIADVVTAVRKARG
jgi:hypothetical protein